VKPRLLFHLPLKQNLQPVVGYAKASVQSDSESAPIEFWDDGVRAGLYFGPDSRVDIPMQGNFNPEAGTVMLYFKPDWDADLDDELGRIVWDLRIDHGSIMPDDPSQRWALVYPNPSAVRGGRSEETVARWRFCVETDRNRYVIGTKTKRSDSRTRQAVWGKQQSFRAGDWLHLAVTWTTTEGAIFVNSREEGRTVLKEGLPWRPLPESMQLGAFSSWMNAGACGIISDFRVYDGALRSASEGNLRIP
jgi:hypothetical protein